MERTPCHGTQPYARYTADEHARWSHMLYGQTTLIHHLAAPDVASALDTLALSADAIPHFEDLDATLHAAVGWRILAVDGLLPAPEFFSHLARRLFPVTWWLRDAAQEGYIVEPDLFHDLVGHLPALMVPAIADFTQAYGRAVSALAAEPEAQSALVRLYWYTIEFGLVAKPPLQHFLPPAIEPVSAPPTPRPRSPRPTAAVYGAGLLSSSEEIRSSLFGASTHLHASLVRMLSDPYEIDKPQPRYFVLPSLQWLLGLDEAFLLAAARRVAATQGNRHG